MKRTIGVTFSGINDAHLAKIKAVSAEFNVLCAPRDSEELLNCEIVFGHIDQNILTRANNLKWLHIQFSGVDPYLKSDSGLRDDIILTNSAGAYGIGIAEHLMAMTLMLMRKMPEYGLLQAEKNWKDLGRIRTLYGSVVTVVGVGDIGANFAARCKVMGANVRGVARTAKATPDWADRMFHVEHLDEAIADADVVALCLPQTAETSGLFDARRINLMKHGAIILNVGRGSAIDTSALIDALNAGHLGGAGLDVTDPEPLPPNHPLWAAPNTIITPHVSGGDSAALTQDLIVDKFARYLADYAAGRSFAHVVDRRVGY